VQVSTATGQLEALRIAQLTRINRVQPPPGGYVPGDILCREQGVIGFQGGLPLSPGHAYAWKLSIDGQSRPDWEAHFLVAGPPPGPVFGGPAGPSSIPDLEIT
jgi:hypothetical protein